MLSQGSGRGAGPNLVFGLSCGIHSFFTAGFVVEYSFSFLMRFVVNGPKFGSS